MDQPQWIRWSGRSGVLGAVILVVGDMLIGGWRPLAGPDFVGLDIEELTRLTYQGARTALLVGPLLGPVPALFYALG